MMIREPFADYLRSPAVSRSDLDLMAKSPADYRYRRDHPEEAEDTAAMIAGTALHCLVLEPASFGDRFASLPPDAPRRPGQRQINARKPAPETISAIEWWARWREENSGKIELPPAIDADELKMMAACIRAHPVAGPMLSADAGLAETSIYWTDPASGVKCRCRPDYVNLDRGLCIDLKTIRDGAPGGFDREVFTRRYDIQAAFYLRGIASVDSLFVDGFRFIAIEKARPYGAHVLVRYLAQPDLDAADERIGRELARYAECLFRGEWPGYPSEASEIVKPHYMRNSYDCIA